MQALDGIYAGLNAIWNTEFPKPCPRCGRVYESIQEYLSATAAPSNSTGLMDLEAGDSERQVGLFRNCSCGSTLMAFCRDRRDLSEAGQRRRELFGQLLQQLAEAGLPGETARLQLLRALKTGKLAQLEETFRHYSQSEKIPRAPLD
ncbi:MAG TPA: hypothetical protein VIS74_05615 [Chthoniobacterales bacterium]